MADKKIEYKFKIDVFTPKTIPMLRLGEYMAEVAKLLANTSSVHFDRLEESSCVLVSAVDWDAGPKVEEHLTKVKRREASNEDLQVIDRLNSMLQYDNAVGYLTHLEGDTPAQDIYFAGRDIPKPKLIGPFSEHASVKAMLYRIGGKDKTAHAQLIDGAGRTWNGTLTQEQAAEMAAAGGKGLYKWFQVDGTAKWVRTAENVWKLEGFHIENFRLLPMQSLEQDLEALRSVKGSKWAEMDDPLGYIEESRRDDGGVH
jgi:hypothetical protein